MTNLVSIIIPVYNSETYISETLNSIINQTYKHIEILITDDYSSDNTISIIKNYCKKDERIKLFCLEKNLGPGAARNNSINHSKGKYIAFCDSDDLWKKNKLELQINFMKENNLSFTYSNYDLIDEKGKFKKIIKSPNKITYDKMLRNNYVGCLTVIYDVEKLGKKYMPLIRKRQDWVLWLNILKQIKKTVGLDKSLALYRNRSKSISSNKIKMISYNWEVYHTILGYSKFQSFFLILKFLFFYVLKKIK